MVHAWPYLIEPSHWSDAAYVIGHSDEHGRVTTFKIGRIALAEPTTQGFTIPETFDERELLRYAWGIWYDDAEPVTVRLRFEPGPATRRLRESRWHPSEEITDTRDGGCIWQAQVDAWQEMLPWVRGWGAAVEVLAPPDLRERVADEVREMVGRYGEGEPQ